MSEVLDALYAASAFKPQPGRAQLGPMHVPFDTLTGSGACVFAAFDDEATARTVHARLGAAGPSWQAWVAPGLDRHPLSELIPA